MRWGRRSRCGARPSTCARTFATTWHASKSSSLTRKTGRAGALMQDFNTESDFPIAAARPAARRSRQARIAWGSNVVTVGGDAPVRVQSMTNTDTVAVIETAIQVKELALAGSEMVRITVNTPEA